VTENRTQKLGNISTLLFFGHFNRSENRAKPPIRSICLYRHRNALHFGNKRSVPHQSKAFEK